MARMREIVMTGAWIGIAEGPGYAICGTDEENVRFSGTQASTGHNLANDHRGLPLTAGKNEPFVLKAGERLWVKGKPSAIVSAWADVEV